MFSIYRSDCSANQTRGQFWIKTNLEKKKKASFNLDAFHLQPHVCWHQHKVKVCKDWAEALW